MNQDYPVIELTQNTHPILWERLPKPPERIFCQGLPHAFALLDTLPDRGLAVVGTRHPTARSVQLVQRTLSALKQQNLIIVSGLALGIDRAAHASALQNQLRTIAVLGTPLDSIYPLENLALKREILFQGGLVISEFPPDTRTEPWHFTHRNRIIATWSKATWMVEAPRKSGALNTLQWAVGIPQRTCYVTPCFPGDAGFEGNQASFTRLHSLQALWDASSLGSTWIEFGALQKKRKPRHSLPLQSEVQLFLDGLDQLGGQQKPISPDSALDHFLDQPEWNASRFFEAARSAIQAGYVTEERGNWKVIF